MALKRKRGGEEFSALDSSSAYTALVSSLNSTMLQLHSKRNETSGDKNAEDDVARNEAADSLVDEQLGPDDNVAAVEDEALSDAETAIPDEFKLHLEHNLSEEEIQNLEAGSSKFVGETPALGIQRAKWVSTTKDISLPQSKLSSFNIKKRLKEHWLNAVKENYGDFRSEQQYQFFSLCYTYRDILHSRKASLIGGKTSSQIMDAYLLHILNHVLKTRDLVMKNNSKPDPPRDQGFTRPKVLFLLPLRSTALKLVKRLIDLLPPKQKSSVEHKQKFFDEFGVKEDETTKKKASKPADYQSLFSGNNDDNFRIGLKLTRKTINLYSDFYSSDIIVASPLGLMLSIGEAEADKQKDLDFLSSIEILVIDFTNVILMQNWSHVLSIFEHLNKIPSKQHEADIMRVREWYLNGHARYFRQTIILSAHPDAAVNALFHRSCFNFSGKIKLQCQYEGVLSNVVLQVRQVYERLDCSDIKNLDDVRFEFFVKQIFPGIKASLQNGYLLFVRSYFDFVRLRNFLKAENASFCLLGEYTKTSDISRSRTWFFHGERKLMLYTERAHFFHRFRIRGIRELIFYSLPDHANFYSELTNMMEGVESPSCTAIFSKFDNLQLERIVGSSRAKKLLSSKTKTLMFC